MAGYKRSHALVKVNGWGVTRSTYQNRCTPKCAAPLRQCSAIAGKYKIRAAMFEAVINTLVLGIVLIASIATPTLALLALAGWLEKPHPAYRAPQKRKVDYYKQAIKRAQTLNNEHPAHK